MSAPKLISFLLMAAFAINASADDVDAARGLESPVRDEVTEQVSTPDEARIATDLKNHYPFVGNLALAAGPGSRDQADSLAIRTSVRKGEVMEFRVTSVYYVAPAEPPHPALLRTAKHLDTDRNLRKMGSRAFDS